jgi:hypothetical protein
VSLRELHDELDAELAPPVPEGFAVVDEGSAEWALRKLARARREYAEAVIVADAQRSLIDRFLETKRKKLDHDESFFGPLLESYHRRCLEDDPKAKTLPLPSGTLKARKQPDEWTFTEDFIEWAKANRPALVRIKEEPEKAAAKKLLGRVLFDDGSVVVVDAETGEEVPGVGWHEGDVKYSQETLP